MKRTFKDYITATILVLITVVSMSACGDAQVVSSRNSSDENSKISEDIQWDYAYDFSEGLAWVDFKSGKNEGEINSYNFYYMGVINKNGEMIFRIEYEPTDLISVTKYHNGYAHVTYQDRMDVIDTTGEVVSSQSVNDMTVIRAYGDGYILTEEHHTDFDSNDYIYKIYSPDGKTLKTVESSDCSNFVHTPLRQCALTASHGAP